MSSTLPNDPDEQNHEQQQDYTIHEDERLLKAALSSDAAALNVQRNPCFDPNNVDQRYHPVGSSLRTKLQQRWNTLVSLTAKERMMITTNENQTIADGQEVLLPEASTTWFQTICEKHTESGRYYHTIVHLWEMFELLDIVVANKDKHLESGALQKSSWYVPMAWSIFFHDSIYNPKSNRNEKDSADLFRKFVDEMTFMDETTVDTILTLILATERHQVILPSTNGLSKQHTDHIQDRIAMQKYFLDIDMAVLGKHRDAYFKYAALIRNEYEFVPHHVYCTKRADILESFLVGESDSSSNSGTTSSTNGTTKQIYLTNPFRDVFGMRAKENLRDEIELLRKNTIPS